jgi:hypothetical protein
MQNDFFNNIGTFLTCRAGPAKSDDWRRSEVTGSDQAVVIGPKT